jgi:hypothetical protein
VGDILEIWVYFKPDIDSVNRPSLELTAWSSDLTTVEGIDVLGSATQWKDFVASVNLYPHFKNLSNKEQFDAVVTCYFLLAAEAGLYESRKHKILASHKLLKNLSVACNSVAEIPSKKTSEKDHRRGESQTSSHKKRSHSAVAPGARSENEACILEVHESLRRSRNKKPRPDDPVFTPSKTFARPWKPMESPCLLRSPPLTVRTTCTRSSGVISLVNSLAARQKMSSAPGMAAESRNNSFNPDARTPVLLTTLAHLQHGQDSPIKALARTFSTSPTPTELEVFDLQMRQSSDRIARCSEDAQIYFTHKEAANQKLQKMVEMGKKEGTLQWLNAIKSLDKDINEKMGVIHQMVEEKKTVEGAFSREVVRGLERYGRKRSGNKRTS